MPPHPPKHLHGRPLDPIERTSEVLFGVFMALTFTGAVSAASAGREEIREALVGALGCNVAWGLADAVMYLVNLRTERGRDLAALRAARRGGDPAIARQALADSLPTAVASVARDEELDALAGRLAALPDLPKQAWLGPRDWLAALTILVVVVLSTFPLVVPFLLLDDARMALRWSHGVALVLLFGCGFQLGRHGRGSPLRNGLWMMLMGAALVVVIILLGG
jgi:VIT1/CCC1 family predicted Fe2+/Mn2+ transporter